MDYKQTLEWMFAQLPMYQRQGAIAYKADLSNTIQLAAYLGNPETRFKSVHVAGTNGKGSTSHMLASVLQEAGYKVGLYTSPHLKDFRERIKINGDMVPQEFVVDFINRHRTYLEANQLSFFEMTVGMAFQYFSEEKVDIAIVEVGLGGRLDSTNIITPEVSVITNIGLDHTQFLGDTLSKIAREKAGIIKKGIPVVIGRSNKETKRVFEEIAFAKESFLYWAERYRGEVFPSDLLGKYQKENSKTAIVTCNVLQKLGWKIPQNHIRKGLLQVVNNTGLLGRWQVLQKKPKIICDTAHNEDGLSYVMQQLLEEEYEDLHIVLGMVNDKKIENILPLFPSEAFYYFAKPDISRGLEAKIVQKEASKFGCVGDTFLSVPEAYTAALERAKDNDLIYVGGSTFVVAEII